jgi:hypothetical protein
MRTPGDSRGQHAMAGFAGDGAQVYLYNSGGRHRRRFPSGGHRPRLTRLSGATGGSGSAAATGHLVKAPRGAGTVFLIPVSKLLCGTDPRDRFDTGGAGLARGRSGADGGDKRSSIGNSTCCHRGAGGGMPLSGARHPAKFLVFPHNFACQGGQGFL